MADLLTAQVAGGLVQIPTQGIEIGPGGGDGRIYPQRPRLPFQGADLPFHLPKAGVKLTDAVIQIPGQPRGDADLVAALVDHQLLDEGAVIRQAQQNPEVVTGTDHHQDGRPGEGDRFQAAGLGADEQAFAQKAGLVEQAVRIHAIPAHGAQGLVQIKQIVPLPLAFRQLLLEEIQAGAPDPQPVQGLIGEMDRVADQGARPLPGGGQVILMAGDQLPPAPNEETQSLGVRALRQPRVRFQFHHPGAGQDLGGAHRLLVGDVDLEPAGLNGTEAEHGFYLTRTKGTA